MIGLFEKIEMLHSKDPVKVVFEGEIKSRESVYSLRMVGKLEKLIEKPEYGLQIAARCHHFCRWEVDRGNFPKGKTGYYSWRNMVYKHQAEKAKELMLEENIPNDIQERVLKIIKKENIKNDSEVQLMEDIACLVFMEHYIEDFGKQHNEEKLVDIIRKTLQKMSDKGRSLIQPDEFPPIVGNMIDKYKLL